MTTKGYRRLLAGASALCVGVGLILLPSAAFASGKADPNGAAKGLVNNVGKNSAAPTPTATTSPPTTLAAQANSSAAANTTSPTTLPPQPTTKNEVPGGPGANNQTNNPYASNGVGLPSGNGNGNGNATGKPCAGCVGKADNKNPPGQAPGGSDHNAGYECDRNHGIGRTNPAHTGCTTTTVQQCVPSASNDNCCTSHCGCVPSASNDNCCTSNCGCVPSASNNHCCTSNCGGCVPSASNDHCCTSNCGGCVPSASNDHCCTSNCGSTSASTATTATTATTVAPGSVAAGHGSSTTVAPAEPAAAVKTSSGSLAFTGADLGGEFLAGGIALAAGALLLGSSRRRRSTLGTEAETDTVETD